jgi:hypothetical protein
VVVFHNLEQIIEIKTYFLIGGFRGKSLFVGDN